MVRKHLLRMNTKED